MGKETGITWCDHTYNPWWGCTEVSEGCHGCYAKTLSTRYGFDVWGAGKQRRSFGNRHWNEPRRWNAQAKKENRRHRVFCASMADVFDAEVPNEWRDRLWDLICDTTDLDWLLLTKRHTRIQECLPDDWDKGYPNVWLGVSVENQHWANVRISALLKVPAAIHFVSAEPLLGPIDIGYAIGCGYYCNENAGHIDHPFWMPGVNPLIEWIIVGGESGPHARPMHPDWARSLRDQCQAASVPFFFKQWGEWKPVPTGWFSGDTVWKTSDGSIPNALNPKTAFLGRVGKRAAGDLLDSRQWHEFPQAK